MTAPILNLARRTLIPVATLVLCWGLPSGCQFSRATTSSGAAGAPGAVAPIEASVSLAPRAAVANVLDDWHAAASVADAERYLGHFTPNARFLGTDAVERWSREGFSTYVNSYFIGQNRGWTYAPRDRYIDLSADSTVAWFDELLDNAGYGELRGTGVLLLEDGRWRIAQYSMSFTVPNGVARDVVARIQEYEPQR